MPYIQSQDNEWSFTEMGKDKNQLLDFFGNVEQGEGKFTKHSPREAFQVQDNSAGE